MYHFLTLHCYELIKLAQISLPLILLATTHYFLIIRPQKIQRQHFNELKKRLCVGNRATTKNNLAGTIIFLDQQIVILELDNGQKIDVLKTTITHVTTKN
ncbi:MAG: preprotein translocase subunit YajC [Epsilonproteobacteria bacterium]|nr:preprotein translocase subunit YajC [Campylobacterota bacterium]